MAAILAPGNPVQIGARGSCHPSCLDTGPQAGDGCPLSGTSGQSPSGSRDELTHAAESLSVMVMNMAQTFLAIMVVYPFSDPGTAIQLLQLAINYHAALRWGTLASLPGVPSVTGKQEGQACSALLPGKTLGPTQTSQCQVGSGTPRNTSLRQREPAAASPKR